MSRIFILDLFCFCIAVTLTFPVGLLAQTDASRQEVAADLNRQINAIQQGLSVTAEGTIIVYHLPVSNIDVVFNTLANNRKLLDDLRRAGFTKLICTNEQDKILAVDLITNEVFPSKPQSTSSPIAESSSQTSAGIDTRSPLQKMVSAKNVLLVIASQPGEGSVDGLFGEIVGAQAPAYEELAKAVRKWNRFVIVTDVSKADLVLLVVEWVEIHRWGNTVACHDWLLVFDGGRLPTGKSQPLWQGDRKSWGKWGGCSGAGRPVKELQKEIEKANNSGR